MAIRASRVLPPFQTRLGSTAGLRNLLGQSRFDFLDEPAFISPSRSPLKIVLDLDEIIEVLDEIASRRSGNSIGFNPHPKSESDVRIGKMAEKLAKNLKDPDGMTIQTAIKFISTCGLIEGLKDIEKKRSNSLNMFSQRSKSDIILGNKAHELILALERAPESPNGYALDEAIEFQDHMQTVEELEEIVSEKLESGRLGFGNKDEDPGEKDIGKKAAYYLNALKEGPPDELTRRKAKIFIEMLGKNGLIDDNKRKVYSSEIVFPGSQIDLPGFF